MQVTVCCISKLDYFFLIPACMGFNTTALNFHYPTFLPISYFYNITSFLIMNNDRRPHEIEEVAGREKQ